MIDDLIQQQAKLQKQVDGLIKPELSPDLISPFLSIPGLVGFWPMSSVQRSSGNAYDQSGQGRTLTYNGNPTYSYYANIVPFILLDGVGDYLSRTDETDLDILGTETIYIAAARGLTLGGWFYTSDNTRALQGLITKDNVALQRSYALAITNTSIISAFSTDGFTLVSATKNTVLVNNAWYFIVGRYRPSTEIALFGQGIPIASNVVGIPASLFNSNTQLDIGGFNGAFTLAGGCSLCFLSANALSDAKISSIFQQTRGAFGV